MPNRLICLINQHLFAKENSQIAESFFESIFEFVSACSYTNGANTASEEEDCGEYNCDDTNNKTCGTETCGLTCCSESLLAANGKNETYDCNRKCNYREPSSKEAEYKTYNAKYETGCCLTFHDKNSFLINNSK